MRHLHTRRLVFAAASTAVSLAAALLPLAAASCGAIRRQPRADEPQAVERLRALTHPDDLRPPTDAALAQIESAHPDSRAGALARLARARLKFDANDFNAAAALADGRVFREHTTLGDYALLMRAEALAKLNRPAEARSAFAGLASDFPDSPLARTAALRSAELALQNNEAAAVPALVKKLADADDGDALLVTAKAYARQGDAARARAAYRRAYFYASGTNAAAEAATALAADAAARSPENASEALARADRLYDLKLHAVAADAYALAAERFPAAMDARARLRHGTSALNAKRYADAVRTLAAVPTGAGDARAEALFHTAQAQGRMSQWEAARTTVAELRRGHPDHTLTRRAGAAVGTIARELKNNAEAANFFRAATAAHPGAAEVAGAQFELAWSAHEARNFQESSRLLVEHLAAYADRNTDNRGRAGYWAARDSERAGKLADARALYRGMLQRYDANWYGHLARERLKTIERAGSPSPPGDVSDGSPVARAVTNLSTVTVAEETAVEGLEDVLRRADELNAVGLDARALEELEKPLADAPASPRLNLAKAMVLRTSDRNVEALVVLQKSFPDYAQMKPEELTREQWDVFYPLEHWETIVENARARSLDPYRVASVIRQETVFNPRAESPADAYGLMQLLLDTARSTARRVGARVVTSKEELYEPRLNIQLGTAYLRQQLDRYDGRIEYAAAAYNAGPGRADRWKTELPSEIDEWTEAVPFRETRGYVQGVIRNTLQYQRLYDERGRFRPEVGTRPVRPHAAAPAAVPAPANKDVRPRRAPEGEGAREEGDKP